MIEQVRKELGTVNVRGFQWPAGVPMSRANERHIIHFHSWNGEIFVKSKGLMTYREYYKLLIEKGFCLYINGYIIGRTGYSEGYNSLHKQYLKRVNATKKQAVYPLKDKTCEAVFLAAVQLFQKGVITKEKLKQRVDSYIEESQQDVVFNEVVYHTPSEKAIS